MIISRKSGQNWRIIFIIIVHYITNEWEDSSHIRLQSFTNVPPASHGFDWRRLITPIILPISNIYDIITYSSVRLRLSMATGKINHAGQLEHIQSQVKAWRVEGGGKKMCTLRPQWMSITPQPKNYKNRMYGIQLNLEDILEIDTEKLLVKVEPSVTIGMLNRALVAKGFTLEVVPELDQLTIGGLVMGGGIESTSHIYGLFHHTCTEYELILADASVIIANKDVNADVFHAVPMSYGTLGFLTVVTIRVIPYKPFIRLEYIPTRSLEETVETFTNVTGETATSDSVEGIMFSYSEAVIMTGTFVHQHDVELHLVNNIGLWYKPWFYLHVMSALETGRRIEYIPTLQFHQRHNKPCFWLSHNAVPYGHTFLMRALFGWMLPFNFQLMKWLKNKLLPEDHPNNIAILQDFMIPLPHLKTALEFSFDTIDILPIWMVPSKLYMEGMPEELKPHAGDVIYVDMGFYGFTRKWKIGDPPGTHRRDVMRRCERFIIDHRGYQALHADTYLTLQEFKQMFRNELYEKVRDRLPLCREGFPDVYDKISKKAREH